MNKRTILTLLASIVLIALAGFSVYSLNQNSHDKKLSTDTDTTADTETKDIKTGKYIILSKFNAKFALPERFDVTDIKILYKTTDKYEVAVVASKSLPAKLNKDMCGGGTLAMGSFAEITRYKSRGTMDDLQQIGSYFYRVDEGPAASTCYDAATYNNYYAKDVVQAIQQSLQSE